MTTRTIKTLLRQIERKKVALAKIRDELRDLESDASAMAEDANEAIASLTDATDALSRLV